MHWNEYTSKNLGSEVICLNTSLRQDYRTAPSQETQGQRSLPCALVVLRQFSISLGYLLALLPLQRPFNNLIPFPKEKGCSAMGPNDN